jgi:hypothetical protein
VVKSNWPGADLDPGQGNNVRERKTGIPLREHNMGGGRMSETCSYEFR